MTCSERLHITASRAKAKSIDRIFQIPILYAINLSPCRENHFTSLHFLFCRNIAVRFYDTVQTDMSPFCHIGIMIYNRTTVDQNTMFNDRVRIHNCLLHHKCAVSNHCALTDHG